MTQENSKKKWSANAEKSDAETGQSLGAYLQRERQKKQLSLQDVAEATRIPPESLQALESGNKSLLPVTVFTRGFVKIYAAHLGLDQAEVLERFSNEWGAVDNEAPEMLSCESMAESSPFFLSFRFYFLLLLFALLISLAYFFFQADDTPPPAALTTIPSTTEEPQRQLVVPRDEVKQVTINPSVAPPETLLISPQSAGKISMEEDETPPEQPLDQQIMATTMEASDAGVKPPVSALPENISSDIVPEPMLPETSSAVPASQPAIPEVPAPVVQQATPSFFQSVNLHIRFTKRTHISVAQDDGRPEKFIFTAGEESSWQAASHITLHVDDADAVELTLNGTLITVGDNSDGSLAITLPTDLNR